MLAAAGGCAADTGGRGDNKENAALSGELKDGVRTVEVKAFRYAFSPDPITVKKGEKVRLLITSTDVEHGFGIRELGINEKIFPDKITTVQFDADKAGVYHIHCTYYCGPGHDEMHGTLKIVE